MAGYLNENVYTHTFTPREYQVELLESVKKKNTVVCSSTSSSKAFIVVKLLQEYSWEMRLKEGKRALLIMDKQNVDIMACHIRFLTDLNIVSLIKTEDIQWGEIFQKYHVIITTAENCVEFLYTNCSPLDLNSFNLLVIDDCLYGKRQGLINSIMNKYQPSHVRVLGLTSGLLGCDLQHNRLESELIRLEKLLHSTVDTSSEIVTLIRLSCRPKETIIVCPPSTPSTCLQDTLKIIIMDAKSFLTDHRFDPSEIYGKDLFNEFYTNVPDPRVEPIELLDIFLNVLEDLGPWCADRAAFSILSQIEKIKVKIPYERHYLIFCMTSTILVNVRAACDYEFEQKQQDLQEMDKIKFYSTNKVLKFIELLMQFKPPGEKPIDKPKVQEPGKDLVKNKGKGGYKGPRRPYVPRNSSDEFLCALVFVNNRYTAKTVFNLLAALSQYDNERFWWISSQFAVEKIADPVKEIREAEQEHKMQEEVLRKFRSHECNILVSTGLLEKECDLPKCNLVVRFDLPSTFHSYIQSKARARANDAHYILFANQLELMPFVENLAEYNEVENTLLKRCSSLEPTMEEEVVAEAYSSKCRPYKPLPGVEEVAVTLTNSIALINKYCAKLPSDTFTRLTPLWQEEELADGKFICSLRLPINSPVKQTVTSPSSVNALLSRSAAAFMMCQLLHKAGEFDDNLQPIGKENFRANEQDWNNFSLDEPDDETSDIRPGTTKRRQYYYKRMADALLDCHPHASSTNKTYFYRIVMTLTCPLPEEQNTRGRKIYPPEESRQGFGILTSKPIPKISAFPIFTRSGEVSVAIELCKDDIILSENQILKIREFVNYTFTSVLRLQKYLMLFDPNSSSNNYLIVPTKHENNKFDVDWSFIDVIYENLNVLPELIPDENRKKYEFRVEDYKDAVVMPWYRNQDQPQYFYVAQICGNLHPRSAFPGSEYATFEEYYKRKYGLQIQNPHQSLLDVDHTSARLNFLTPRYVNRKGVALPTSSEETKKAKRENLEQKQILIPELCAIHPFPASLWRKAVCLPCILYRINALLLTDQIRKTVAGDLHLGTLELKPDFKWPALNFGWSLSDVLQKSRQEELRKLETKVVKLNLDELMKTEDLIEEISRPCDDNDDDEKENDEKEEEEEEEEEEMKTEDNKREKWSIGTWSNEMARTSRDDTAANENNLVRYASPTSWLSHYGDDDFSDSDSTMSDESESQFGGLRIEFKDNVAEALDDEEYADDKEFKLFEELQPWKDDDYSDESELSELSELRKQFEKNCEKNKQHILESGIVVAANETYKKAVVKRNLTSKQISVEVDETFLAQLSNVEWFESPEVYNDLSPDYRNTYDISESEAKKALSFSFDFQPDLHDHPGPSPNVLLQALTMSNANDGINLERLETIGDSFLKYAITNYLYAKYEHVHEGKLSHLRSKQVSNLNLYRLGKRKQLGDFMIATKFDPHDNWLPPCFYVPKKLEEALIDAHFPANCWTMADMAATRDMTLDEICTMVRKKGETCPPPIISTINNIIPYNLVTQHSIPDKSIADCVEALIGAYLIECGPRGAHLFMAWLGIRVLPQLPDGNGTYGEVLVPHSPLRRFVDNPEAQLERLLDGYDAFEKHIGYKFRDRSYLLQALTHASYSPNQLTDCYQRLEFLGDAVLDYLITRHLYEDKRMHSPGALTDLRSALVNNTIFASLAVRNGFHKYFKHLSPGLNEVIEKFIRLQEESGHALFDELYLVAESECDEVEDVEVPKALGDVFESVAGAIFLDSGMSLDAVFKVYYQMMKNEIEQFSNKVPKSPIRELLELEPETAKFGKPEKLADGRRVRVTVEIFGVGVYKGIGRNYRIAKCTAAKCALKHLKQRGLIKKIE